MWPLTGSPQDEQHAGFLLTDAEAGVDAIGAMAQAVDIIGEGEMAGTTVTLAKVEVTGAVAEMEATDAEAGMIGATETEAGVVAAETVAVEGMTGAEEEMGVEDAGFAAC